MEQTFSCQQERREGLLALTWLCVLGASVGSCQGLSRAHPCALEEQVGRREELGCDAEETKVSASPLGPRNWGGPPNPWLLEMAPVWEGVAPFN